MRYIFSFALLLLAAPALAAPVPRTIIGLYDGREFKTPDLAPVHRFAEMPLNHLGLTVEYHDVRKPLPDLSKRNDVRGVLSWYRSENPSGDQAAYMEWVGRTIDGGKKFVVLGESGFVFDEKRPALQAQTNRVLARLGIAFDQCGSWRGRSDMNFVSCDWVNDTARTSFSYKDASMAEFERLLAPKPSYNVFRKLAGTTSYLTARQNNNPVTDAPLIVTNRNGGFVASGYDILLQWDPSSKKDTFAWRINPFRYFAITYATDDLPKADTTTLAGRRIYYSHIDGDGWNSLSEINKYRAHKGLAAEVIMEEAIKPYPDLPITVAPIGGELDSDWMGSSDSRKVARELLALPQVQTGSHTYSHPLDWGFFEDYTPSKEKPFLKRYTGDYWDASDVADPATPPDLKEYTTPRSFAVEPFDLNKEVAGSVAFINSELAPSNKPVRIFMWSGDTAPFEAAVRATREAGLYNINGGDSRFSADYNSYAWVMPVGRPVGTERQIYSSATNENIYTNGWTGPFDGFKQLKDMLVNTETPIRVKPINVYYHMFSGTKQAGVDAITYNLDYARSQPIAPISAVRYAGIANGFYGAAFNTLGKDSWRITGRGALQTIRFDKAEGKAVDYSKSTGVIGHMHHQGSLYTYLDEAVKEPVLTLGKSNSTYLIDSRWRVWGVKVNGNTASFTADGYGAGDMRWHVPENGDYRVTVNGKAQAAKSTNGIVQFILPKGSGGKPVTLEKI